MPAGDSYWGSIIGILLVLLLVAANGFFVAAEFALVAVRRSRVAELIANKRRNAGALGRALDHLDSNLAATQLGITISSLALGWVGEPALGHLIHPLLSLLPVEIAAHGAEAAAIVISFMIITALHIVLGELAPKSLALQRSEGTALTVVRPLQLFLLIFRPAIVVLNGLGNRVLRLCGLQPGGGEGALHSADELKLLVAASQEAGLLQHAQQEVVARVLTMGNRSIGDLMTPRTDVDWVDLDDPQEEQMRAIRACQHQQLLVARGEIDEPVGMIVKPDILDRLLDGAPVDIEALMRQPLVLHEATPIFRVLEQFKRAPVRLAIIVDEYGILQGIVTQTDLLEAMAGELPGAVDEEPDIAERNDGALVIRGMTSILEAYGRLGLAPGPHDDFRTIAGFALARLGHLPEAGEHFEHGGWRFDVMEMDGRRIGKLLATRVAGRAEAHGEFRH